jgi:hypothetical protein
MLKISPHYYVENYTVSFNTTDPNNSSLNITVNETYYNYSYLKNLTLKVNNFTLWRFEGNLGLQDKINGSLSLATDKTKTYYLSLPYKASVSEFSFNVRGLNNTISFEVPYSIKYLNNTLYVLDTARGRVFMFDANLSYGSYIGNKLGSELKNLKSPKDFVVVNSKVKVLDDYNSKILDYNSDNSLLDNGIININDDKGMLKRIDYDNDSDHYLLIDNIKSNLIVLDANYTIIKTYSKNILNNDDSNLYNLTKPADICINSNNLYILDSSDERIFVFDKWNGTNYNLNKVISMLDGLDYNWSSPLAIDCDDEKLYLGDTGHNLIRVYDINSNYALNSSTSFNSPISLAFSDNEIWAIDGDNARISKLVWNGSSYSVNKTISSFGSYYPYNSYVDVGNDLLITPFKVYKYVEFVRKDAFFNYSVNKTLNSADLNRLNSELARCSDYYFDSYNNKICRIPVVLAFSEYGILSLTNITVRYSANFSVSNFEDDLYREALFANNFNLTFNFSAEGKGHVNLSELAVKYSSNVTDFALSNISSNLWFKSIQPLNSTGNYKTIIYAKDPSNHIGSYKSWIYNYALIRFIGNIVEENSSIEARLILRPTGADSPVVETLDAVDEINTTIYNTTYNLDINLTVPIKNNNSLRYQASVRIFDATLPTSKDNTTNETYVGDPIKFKAFDIFNITLPTLAKNHPDLDSTVYAGVAAQNNLKQLGSIVVTFNYSSTYDLIKRYDPNLNFTPIQDNFKIYRCADSNPNNCSASQWLELSSSQIIELDKTNHIIRFNISSFSTYILVEKNVTSTEDETKTDDNRDSSTDSSSSRSQSSSSSSSQGGGLSSYSSSNLANGVVNKAYCGDGICDKRFGETSKTCPQDCEPSVIIVGKCGNSVCELGENIYNCPEDCSIVSLNYELSDQEIYAYAGQSRIITLKIKNPKEVSQKVNLVFDVPILNKFFRFSEDSFTIPSKSEKNIKINMTLPQDEKPMTYFGNIIIEAGLEKDLVPLTLNILSINTIPFKAAINTLSSKLRLMQDKLIVKVDLHDIKYKYNKIDLNYIIKDSNTDKVILEINDSIDPNTHHNFIKEINIFNLSKSMNITIPEGNYLLIVKAITPGYSTFSSVPFKVYKPILTPFRIRLISGISILIFLLILSYYLIIWYKKWKLSRMRYIPPEFELLPKKSERALWLGKIPETTRKAYFNPDDLTTHALVAGSTGSGKSVSASIMVEEILLRKIPVVVFDPTSQWTGFVKQCRDENLLKYYKEFGLKEEDSKSFKGLIYNVTDPNIRIDFKKYMNPGEITVFNLNALKPGEYDQAVLHIVNTVFEIPWNESPELRLLLVFDEVHRLLEKYGGKGGYVALEKAAREFRKWGIGLIMASQVSTDFKEAVAGNILTEVQMNTKSMDDIKKIAQKYGIEYSSKVTRQGIGVGMLQNPKYNNGKPWFVHFRPTLHSPHKIPQEELEKYSEYSEKIDYLVLKIRSYFVLIVFIFL